MRRFGLVFVIASLSVLLIVVAADGSGEPFGAEAAKAKAKKCKGKKVRVKIGKRTKCVPVKAALPTPRAVDQRLTVVREGLTPPIGSTPDPKDKLPVPMEKVYRQFGPKALPAMEKVVGVAIPKLDKLGAARRLSAGTPLATVSEAGNTFSQTVGGVRIDARLSIAVEATGQFVGRAEFSTTTDQAGGKTLKVTTEIPIKLEHFGFESDVCPGADGKVDATDGLGITVRSELRSNGGKTLDEYYIYEVADDTELQGIVGDDAKLDTLEIRSIEEVTEKAWQPILGGLVAHGTIVRNTVVDMRAKPPAYRPSVTVINVGAVLSGLRSLFPGTVREGVTERLKKAADKGFAATVDFEIKKYRELEAGWTKPNACAKLKFSRANRSLTLHRNDKGSETVQVDAARGGPPAKAKWSVVDSALGAFTLANDSTNPTSFNYEVLFAGSGFEVKATLKAVSKAGVAEDSWIQKTEQKSIEQIAGTFNQRQEVTGSVGTSIFEWSGNATFDRFGPNVIGGPNGSFKLSSGLYTVTVSGKDVLVVGSTCSQKGSKQFALGAGSEFFVLGSPPSFGPPYDYSFTLSSDNTTLPMLTITLFNCGPGAEELEGDSFEYPVALLFQPEQAPQSADGFNYSGNETKTQGAATFSQDWLFHGTE